MIQMHLSILGFFENVNLIKKRGETYVAKHVEFLCFVLQSRENDRHCDKLQRFLKRRVCFREGLRRQKKDIVFLSVILQQRAGRSRKHRHAPNRFWKECFADMV
jgi:hypothetical protein